MFEYHIKNLIYCRSLNRVDRRYPHPIPYSFIFKDFRIREMNAVKFCATKGALKDKVLILSAIFV